MKQLRENIWNGNEYTYAAAYGFIPDIHAYLHDEDDRTRDCILILPGGGYRICAPHEGEPVADEFFKRGMNAFVLTYSTDVTSSVPLKDQPLKDISRAVRFIRKHADEYHIKGGRFIICGFSASGHLCASLITHYNDVHDENPEYADISNRPDGAILSYPVITSGEFTHQSSLDILLGENAAPEELDYFSLEKHVSADTPPCFLWQTQTDELVPVENSYLFAMALRKEGIPFAHYVFPTGIHGLGTVKDTSDSKGVYTMDQVYLAIKALREGRGINVSDARRNEIIEEFSADTYDTVTETEPAPVEDAGLWIELACVWIRRLQIS
ncbi:MAG: alpha/beta hydrolase [Lachnospiraceae bacterium]|nr:alpha/beta hydrolase [Lachnospiraceae bacterium]